MEIFFIILIYLAIGIAIVYSIERWFGGIEVEDCFEEAFLSTFIIILWPLAIVLGVIVLLMYAATLPTAWARQHNKNKNLKRN